MDDPPVGIPPAPDGPWTEQAYLELPRGQRIELVDGSLLVAPSTGAQHAAAVAVVRAAVQAVLPEGLRVSGPVALRLCPGRILVPDLIVSAGTADDPAPEVRDGSAALVVIDVVGSGNGAADRWFKPQLYAGSGIPYAVLVDRDARSAVATMLIGGRFHEYAGASDGETLVLEEPFPLHLDLSTLPGPAPEQAADEAPPAEEQPTEAPPAEAPPAEDQPAEDQVTEARDAEAPDAPEDEGDHRLRA